MNENKKNPVQRFERMKEVIEQRLESVILIVEATYMRHNLSAMFRTAESFIAEEIIEPRETRKYLSEFVNLTSKLRKSGKTKFGLRP